MERGKRYNSVIQITDTAALPREIGLCCDASPTMLPQVAPGIPAYRLETHGRRAISTKWLGDKGL
jgi:hypothetical protein